jgi:transketolase
VNGGLGGAVAEFLAKHCPTPQEFVAVQDTFGESGPGEELMRKYGIDSDAIIKAVRKVLQRKKSNKVN